MRGIITNKKLAAALILLALLASPAGAQQNAGFLTGYSKLAPAADNPDTSLWISQEFDFKPYHKVLLDQIEVFVSPTSEYQGVSPDVLKGMADRFRDSFKKALQPDYQFVDELGQAYCIFGWRSPASTWCTWIPSNQRPPSRICVADDYWRKPGQECGLDSGNGGARSRRISGGPSIVDRNE